MVGFLRTLRCNARCFSAKPVNKPRSAFTLLEILLASVLSATLLLTLWSLLGTYAALFATGGAKTEQSQIARSLLQQMSDDLHSAIRDTAARTHTAFGPNTVRRFGLFGTQHELRIDVLQIVPLEASLAARRFDGERGQKSLLKDKPRRRAPELRTVCYTFNKRPEANSLESFDGMSTDHEPSFAAADGGLQADEEARMKEALLGLVREEMDFETRGPSGTRLAGRMTSRLADGTAPGRNTFDQFDTTGEAAGSEIDARLDSGIILWVPEVAGLEFCYFDGSGWTSQWDSIKQKSLPVAVEIRLKIETPGPRAVRLESGQEAGQAPDIETGPPNCETYRLVVELPLANLHEGPNKPAAQSHEAFGQPLSTPRLGPSILPSPRPPSSNKPPEGKKASEQWLRTSPQ